MGVPMADWRRLRIVSAVAGGAGLAGAAAGAFLSPATFASSWLAAWLFWLALGLGALVMAMLHRVTGGGWGDGLEPVLSAAARTLPLMILLSLPIFLSIHELYSWSRTEQLADSQRLRAQAAVWLNPSFFFARLIVYLLLWWGIGALFRRDKAGAPSAVIGLIIYAVTASLAATDLLMSIQPPWHSSVFGMLFMVAQTFAAMAFAIFAVRWIALAGDYPGLQLGTRDYHDYGNFLLMFVLAGAYLAFISQFIIVWYGNLPQEIAWYLPRLRHGWQWTALALIILLLAVPFCLLLFTKFKRTAAVSTLAGLLLPLHLLYAYWLAVPDFRPSPSLHWIDMSANVGIGGFWLALFLYRLEENAGRPRREMETAHHG